MNLEWREIALSQRSAFYSLEPEGQGALLEGFTGYWRRVAAEHLLSVTDLIEQEPLSALYPFSTSRRERRRLFRAIFYLLDGSASHTELWVNAMERATCRPGLRHLTLMPLVQVCEGSWLRRVRAWCPLCYAYQKESGRPMYEPLIWSIRIVAFCPVHHTKLQEQCPRCHRAPLPVAGDAPPAYCPLCGGWLGSDDLFDQSEQNDCSDSYQSWCSEQICDVVYRLPSLNDPLDLRAVSQALHLVCERSPALSLSALAEITRTPRRSISMWLDGTTRPRVETLSRFCFALNVPLLDFLIGQIPDQMPALNEWTSGAGPRRTKAIGNPKKRARGPQGPLAQNEDVMSTSIIAHDKEFSGDLIQARGDQTHDTQQPGHKSSLSRTTADKVSRETALQDALQAAVDRGSATSPRKIAKAFGYKSPDRVLRKFPILTATLKQRIEDLAAARDHQIRATLERAVRKVPPPTLHDVAISLKQSSSSALRLHEPELCDQLLNARKRWKDGEHKKIAKTFERAMQQDNLPGFAKFCRLSGISPEMIAARFPRLREAYVRRFRNLRSAKRRAENAAFEDRVTKALDSLRQRGEHPSVGNLTAEDSNLGRYGWERLQRAIAERAGSNEVDESQASHQRN